MEDISVKKSLVSFVVLHALKALISFILHKEVWCQHLPVQLIFAISMKLLEIALVVFY